MNALDLVGSPCGANPSAAGRRETAPTFNHLGRRPAAPRAFRATLGALLWLGWCAAAPTPALGQESAEALASRALFDEARRLMSTGEFAAACPKLEESQRLRAGIGTQFNLAECYEKLGRYASAWSLYLHVAADTKALGQAEREQVARTRAQALEARVAYLLLQVPVPVAGLELAVDGSALGAAAWGVPTPIDPGEHSVVASAPGFQTWQGLARIPDRTARVQLQVPQLEPNAPSTPAAAPEPTAPPSASEASADARDRTLPYVIGGTGIGLVAISGLFGLRFLNQNQQAKDVCSENPNACQPSEIEHHTTLLDSARGARTAAFVTLGLGLVGVGVSTVWLLSGASDDTSDTPAIALGGRVGGSAALLDASLRF